MALAFNPLALAGVSQPQAHVHTLKNIIGHIPEGFAFNADTSRVKYWNMDEAGKARVEFHYLKTHKPSTSAPRNHRGAEAVWRHRKDLEKSPAEREAAYSKKRSGPTVVYLSEIPYLNILAAFSAFPRSTGGTWPGAEQVFVDWNDFSIKANKGDVLPVRVAIPLADIPELLIYHNILPSRTWLAQNVSSSDPDLARALLQGVSDSESRAFSDDYNNYWNNLMMQTVQEHAYKEEDVSFDKSGIVAHPDGTYSLPPLEQRTNKFWRFYTELAESNAVKEEHSKEGSILIARKLEQLIDLSTKSNLRTAKAIYGNRTVAENGQSIGTVNDNLSKIILDICDVVGSAGNLHLQRKSGRAHNYVNISKYYSLQTAKATIGSHNEAASHTSSKTVSVPSFRGVIFHKSVMAPNGIEEPVLFPAGLLRVAPQYMSKPHVKTGAVHTYGGPIALENALRSLKVDPAEAKRLLDAVKPELNTIMLNQASKKKSEEGSKRAVITLQADEISVPGPQVNVTVPQFDIGSYINANQGSVPSSSTATSEASLFGR